MVRRITFGEEEVREFCEASNSHYAVVSRARDAQVLGFKNVLVPGPLLTIAQLLRIPAGSTGGSIDAWFESPVTVGAAMTVCRDRDDQQVWAVRAVGSDLPTTVARAQFGHL
jgi:hypothetical protein